jgi:hypothetical protein
MQAENKTKLKMIGNITSIVEFDVALISGLLTLFLASLVTLVGFAKTAQEGRLKVKMGRSEGEKFVNIGSLLTLIALIPLTIYITTRTFPTLFQQLIVTFILLVVFTFIKKARYIVQFPIALTFAFVISIITTALKLVYLPVSTVIEKFPS